MERKTDLRVLKTRNAIKNTFKEMVMEKDASDIQIKELAERVLIHRKTFYPAKIGRASCRERV